jgi:hypothetical protein
VSKTLQLIKEVTRKQLPSYWQTASNHLTLNKLAKHLINNKSKMPSDEAARAMAKDSNKKIADKTDRLKEIYDPYSGLKIKKPTSPLEKLHKAMKSRCTVKMDKPLGK